MPDIYLRNVPAEITWADVRLYDPTIGDGATTYEDIGLSVAILLDSGVEQPDFADTGIVISLLTGAGTDVVDQEDSGISVGLLSGTGADGLDFIDLGGVVGVLSGSGAEGVDFVDLGGGSGILIGSGLDDWTAVFSDTGAGVLIGVGSGLDSYTLVPYPRVGGRHEPGARRPLPKKGRVQTTRSRTKKASLYPRPPTPDESEQTEGPHVIQGKPVGSKIEWNVSVALEILGFRYLYQYSVMGGRTLRGGQVIDFLVLTVPMSTPLYVQGDYWHGSPAKKELDKWNMSRVKSAMHYEVTDPKVIWEHEALTIDLAVRNLQRILSV